MANIDVSRLFFPRETVGFSCRNRWVLVRNVLVFRAECICFSCRMRLFPMQNAACFWGEFVSISYRMNCRTHTLEVYSPSFSFTKSLKEPPSNQTAAPATLSVGTSGSTTDYLRHVSLNFTKKDGNSEYFVYLCSERR